jgi:hypothetical protein
MMDLAKIVVQVLMGAFGVLLALTVATIILYGFAALLGAWIYAWEEIRGDQKEAKKNGPYR